MMVTGSVIAQPSCEDEAPTCKSEPNRIHNQRWMKQAEEDEVTAASSNKTEAPTDGDFTAKKKNGKAVKQMSH